MKDFKKMLKMQAGGSVSFEDAATIAMSKDSSGRPTYGAKTAYGTKKAQESYDKNWMKKESADDTFSRIAKVRDESDALMEPTENEKQRRMPFKKAGGRITKKKGTVKKNK
jgi:hypothetical protein